jgi:O-antigen ligase
MVLILLDQLVYVIPALMMFLFAYNRPKTFLIITSFVALITLTSGLGEGQRMIVQILAITSLLLYFIFTYGLNFNQFPKVPFAILLLVSFIIFTIIFSLLFTDYFQLGLFQLIRSLIFFSIIYLYYSLLKDMADIKYFLYALFLGAVFYFIIIFYEVVKADFDIIYLNQNLILEEGNSFIHRNAIGGFFSITILISIAYLVSARTSRLSKKYIYLFIFFLISGLILTNSRAAILSIFISVIYILFTENKKILLYLLSIIILALPLLWIKPIAETVDLYFRLERVSTGRDFILETVFNILSKNPLIGNGPAATKYEFYNNLPYIIGSPQELFLRRMSEQIEFGQAHNFYLFLYTDLGLFGFIASLLIVFVFLKTSNRLLKETKKTNEGIYPLVLGIQGAGISLFIRGLFEWAGIFSYGTLTYDLPFWWIFSLLIFLYQKIIVEKQKIL